MEKIFVSLVFLGIFSLLPLSAAEKPVQKPENCHCTNCQCHPIKGCCGCFANNKCTCGEKGGAEPINRK